jgi:AraC family transcriptional regulator
MVDRAMSSGRYPTPDHLGQDTCLTTIAVPPNPQGVVTKTIPACRCAVARHLGSRAHNAAAVELYTTWLPRSGEEAGDFPMFFHYVNVGPNVQEHERITDVYLPLRPRSARRAGTPARS